MFIIFDPSIPAVNLDSFGLGLLPAAPLAPAQPDNVTPRHPADSASIDEETARSIAETIARAEADRRESILEREAAKDVYFSRFSDVEREAEEAELAARYDAICWA